MRPLWLDSRVVVILHALRRLLSAGVGVTLEGGEENRIAGSAAIYLFMWFRQYIYRCLVLYIWTARRRVALSGDEIIELARMHACMHAARSQQLEGGGCRCSTSLGRRRAQVLKLGCILLVLSTHAWYI